MFIIASYFIMLTWQVLDNSILKFISPKTRQIYIKKFEYDFAHAEQVCKKNSICLIKSKRVTALCSSNIFEMDRMDGCLN